ncbi:hypothetical protein CAPTEDRAFT_186767 [Capitella teleta]|uniref:TIR domain-containing protein n=1 Tax=Capitella teleta TaxID=283909 RepID=R7T937_CAPTE|nr:hypothetical protein CAPTEDRAFT_186767 [Capitella teleta]|eukprot:ELT90214.1 hypothetical protein CAPTEDRAFT_186767 [Capitella teleta]
MEPVTLVKEFIETETGPETPQLQIAPLASQDFIDWDGGRCLYEAVPPASALRSDEPIIEESYFRLDIHEPCESSISQQNELSGRVACDNVQIKSYDRTPPGYFSAANFSPQNHNALPEFEFPTYDVVILYCSEDTEWSERLAAIYKRTDNSFQFHQQNIDCIDDDACIYSEFKIIVLSDAYVRKVYSSDLTVNLGDKVKGRSIVFLPENISSIPTQLNGVPVRRDVHELSPEQLLLIKDSDDENDVEKGEFENSTVVPGLGLNQNGLHLGDVGTATKWRYTNFKPDFPVFFDRPGLRISETEYSQAILDFNRNIKCVYLTGYIRYLVATILTIGCIVAIIYVTILGAFDLTKLPIILTLPAIYRKHLKHCTVQEVCVFASMLITSLRNLAANVAAEFCKGTLRKRMPYITPFYAEKKKMYT